LLLQDRAEISYRLRAELKCRPNAVRETVALPGRISGTWSRNVHRRERPPGCQCGALVRHEQLTSDETLFESPEVSARKIEIAAVKEKHRRPVHPDDGLDLALFQEVGVQSVESREGQQKRLSEVPCFRLMRGAGWHSEGGVALFDRQTSQASNQAEGLSERGCVHLFGPSQPLRMGQFRAQAPSVACPTTPGRAARLSAGCSFGQAGFGAGFLRVVPGSCWQGRSI